MTIPGPHILYVITDLHVGGVPLHLLHLVDAMRARRFAATVVTLAPDGPVADMMRQAGVTVLSCNGRSGWDVRILGRLGSIIQTVKPDLLHSLLFHANVAARYAAGRTGFPAERIVCEIQTVEVERRWHLLVDRWTHRGCRLTIGNSPSVVNHLHQRARIPCARLCLVKGGIDTSRVAQAEPIDRAALGVNDDEALILWVGRLDPVKGLEFLVKAFGRIASKHPAQLLLVGEGPMRRQLEKHVEDQRLTGRVRLPGVRRDVPSLLKTADLFVFPSRTEGLPNALLEAMAAGCPIVTTDVPGCRDLIVHETTGLVVPFGDTEKLATAMDRMLTHGETAKQFGHAAAEIVKRDWNIDHTWQAYADLYTQTLRST